MTTTRDLLTCAHMILNDQCPPDRRAYLCMHGEEPEDGCLSCWSNYLHYVAAGKTGHPYQWELDLQARQEARKEICT